MMDNLASVLTLFFPILPGLFQIVRMAITTSTEDSTKNSVLLLGAMSPEHLESIVTPLMSSGRFQTALLSLLDLDETVLDASIATAVLRILPVAPLTRPMDAVSRVSARASALASLSRPHHAPLLAATISTLAVLVEAHEAPDSATAADLVRVAGCLTRIPGLAAPAAGLIASLTRADPTPEAVEQLWFALSCCPAALPQVAPTLAALAPQLVVTLNGVSLVDPAHAKVAQATAPAVLGVIRLADPDTALALAPWVTAAIVAQCEANTAGDRDEAVLDALRVYMPLADRGGEAVHSLLAAVVVVGCGVVPELVESVCSVSDVGQCLTAMSALSRPCKALQTSDAAGLVHFLLNSEVEFDDLVSQILVRFIETHFALFDRPALESIIANQIPLIPDTPALRLTALFLSIHYAPAQSKPEVTAFIAGKTATMPFPADDTVALVALGCRIRQVPLNHSLSRVSLSDLRALQEDRETLLWLIQTSPAPLSTAALGLAVQLEWQTLPARELCQIMLQQSVQFIEYLGDQPMSTLGQVRLPLQSGSLLENIIDTGSGQEDLLKSIILVCIDVLGKLDRVHVKAFLWDLAVLASVVLGKVGLESTFAAVKEAIEGIKSHSDGLLLIASCLPSPPKISRVVTSNVSGALYLLHTSADPNSIPCPSTNTDNRLLNALRGLARLELDPVQAAIGTVRIAEAPGLAQALWTRSSPAKSMTRMTRLGLESTPWFYNDEWGVAGVCGRAVAAVEECCGVWLPVGALFPGISDMLHKGL
ncbi:hypothetical protein J8273_7579 [Carpediemonas membranifera]|uniref:Uncharacterized protein n=1 Tax=Carpediemonas membranifera TaxID=201153 RepID=A0A8J6AY86_9EUKA|nr:hypothetical protein J8273_7579 [Carpediemonas membranifera]|eukprot:KAG9391338.1 hypothetical protein J8273_7579 [Carpediemonas membranifera]